MDEGYHIRVVFRLKQNEISYNLLNIFEDFLRNRKQTVVLNGQISNWENIYAGVPLRLYHGTTIVLNQLINDLAENLSSNRKLFADDNSIFSAVLDLNTSENEINEDLKKTEAWTHQWKMKFL